MPEIITENLIKKSLDYLKCRPHADSWKLAAALGIRFSTAEYLRLLILPLMNPDKSLGMQRNKQMIKKAKEEFMEILRERPTPNRSLDQYLCSPSSMCVRVKYLISKGSVDGKKILILGDDDFTSIGLCLLGEPKQVTVIEVDPRIIKKLNKIQRQTSLPMSVFDLDLHSSLPDQLKESFDTVFGDPPYTLKGIKTWLLRMFEALKKSEDVHGYLCFPYGEYISWAKPRLAAIQAFILEQGWVIIDLKHRLFSYEGNDGQKSSLLCFTHTKMEKEEEGLYWWNKQTHKKNKPYFGDEAKRLLASLTLEISRF